MPTIERMDAPTVRTTASSAKTGSSLGLTRTFDAESVCAACTVVTRVRPGKASQKRGSEKPTCIAA